MCDTYFPLLELISAFDNLLVNVSSLSHFTPVLFIPVMQHASQSCKKFPNQSSFIIDLYAIKWIFFVITY